LVGDCQWVAQRAQLHVGNQQLVNPHDAHHDLWQRFADATVQLASLQVLLMFEWVPSHLSFDHVFVGLISACDHEGNSRADEAAKQTARQVSLLFGHGDIISAAKSDAQKTSVRQLYNVVVVQKRWRFLKTANLSVPDLPDDDDNPDQPGDVNIEPFGSSVPAIDPSSMCEDPETTWPSASQVTLCKRQVSHFVWQVPSDLITHHIHGTILSRADNGYAWHYSQENFDAIHTYFHGLEWSSSGKVTYLELFVDWYAYCGSQLVNPKAGRTKPLSTAADYTSSFAAALRSFHKVFAEKVPPHPATCCLVSHLTAFNMLKQATGLNMRPRFRCPSAVHRFLTWSWCLPFKRASWKWTLPLDDLIRPSIV
jgi:hypothetical protein